MYKSAIVSAKGRAFGHLSAYQHIHRSRVTGVCDQDASLLDRCRERFDVPAVYTDLEEMLEKEKPDILHLVTRPSTRVPLLKLASEAGVPAVIVEKPIALDIQDLLTLRELSQQTNMKVAVNHQLQFHPNRLRLQRAIEEGEIGEVQFIDATCGLNLAGQGTHLLAMLFSFNGFSPPRSVFGQVSGGDEMTGEGKHEAPEIALAAIDFENGVRSMLHAGKGAPLLEEQPRHMNKRIRVLGSRGYVHWTMLGWQLLSEKEGFSEGAHEYGEQDLLGQAALTEAMVDWLEDDHFIHPTRFDQALTECEVNLGIYASALRRAPVHFPLQESSDLLPSMKTVLQSEEALTV